MFLLRTNVSTAAITKPLLVDEAKTHMRITSDDDDSYIDSLIKAAVKWVEQYTNRVLITQTLEGWADAIPEEDDFRLIPAPVQSVTEIKSYSTADVSTTFSSTYYRVDTVGGRVHLNWGQTWPTGLRAYDAFYVKWVAGYGLASAVPDGFKHAIRLLVSHWFENREPVLIGSISKELETMVVEILHSYKIFLLT
jgi:uncharacterized phiE125 gp8 family phage protein